MTDNPIRPRSPGRSGARRWQRRSQPLAQQPAHDGLPALTRGRAMMLFTDQSGAATAEYAIATMAAVAFAGLLVVIMRSDEVKTILTDMIKRALQTP